MKRFALGTVLAAVAIFLWGFIFWATPITKPLNKMSASDQAVAAALDANLPETGTYFIPNPYRDQQEYSALSRSGPIAHVFFLKGGVNPMDPAVFAAGFLHMLVTVALIGLLLRMLLPALNTYGARVTFVVLAGFTAAFWSELGDPIWFHHPWLYHVMTAVYDLVSWAIAGLILAYFVRPVSVAARKRAAFAGA